MIDEVQLEAIRNQVARLIRNGREGDVYMVVHEVKEMLDTIDEARRLARLFYREAYNFCDGCDDAVQIPQGQEYCVPCRDLRTPGAMER